MTHQAPKKWTATHLRVGLLMLAAVASMVLGGYMVWVRTPPPLPQTAEDMIGLLASPRFANLSSDRKKAYLQQGRMLLDKLDKTSRQALMKQLRHTPEVHQNMRRIRGEMMIQQARQYAQADPVTRKTIVKAFVARSRKWGQRQKERRVSGMSSSQVKRQRKGSVAANTQKSGSGQKADQKQRRQQRRQQRFRQRAQWIQHRIENGNPQNQAYLAEFFKAVREERKAQGLPDFPGPRGRKRVPRTAAPSSGS